MVQDKINKLLPYINDNFLTYPLWEEGKYIPFVNFWRLAKTEGDYVNMRSELYKTFEGTGYAICDNEDYSSRGIFHFMLYPEYKEKRNGSYEYVKHDWSIEEMLDLLANVLR